MTALFPAVQELGSHKILESALESVRSLHLLHESSGRVNVQTVEDNKDDKMVVLRIFSVFKI